MTHAELSWAAMLAVLALTAAIWIIASASRTARCVLGVRRWNSRLYHRLEGVERDIAMAAAAATEEIRRARALEEEAVVKAGQLQEAETRLEGIRAQGPSEYRLLTDRGGDKDAVFLFTASIGQPPQVQRWAAPAGDSKTAARALAAALGQGVSLKLEGKL